MSLVADSVDTIAVATDADIAVGIPPAFANVSSYCDCSCLVLLILLFATASDTVIATATAFLASNEPPSETDNR